MAKQNRRAGMIYVKVDGQQVDAKGSFSYNLGTSKREALIGSDTIHGYKETPQVAFIEGEVTDSPELNHRALAEQDNATVTLQLANGKTIVLSDAWFAADGNGNTDEANIGVRWESSLPAQVI